MTQDYTSTSGITTTGPIVRGFENHTAGESYDRDKQNIDWDYQSGASNTAAITEISTEEAYSGNQSLKVTYSSDERVKTASKWELPPEQEYFSTYWVFFPEDFEFNGVEKSGAKLPGLGSDEVPTGGDDVTGDNGYSARYMWRYDGQAELYLYHMDKAGTYGDSVKFQYDNGDYAFFEKGEWQQITQRVKVNDGNQANGEIDVWLNGQQVVDIDGVRLSDNGQLTDVFYLSTFYGGGSTIWLPPEDTEAYFDDIIISTDAADHGLSASDIRTPDENPDQRPIGNGVVQGIKEFESRTKEQTLPDGSSVAIFHDRQWGDGYTATLFYTPITDASNWTIQVRLPGPIEDISNAEIVSYENGIYTLRGTTKPELDAGETANIRIKAQGHGSRIEFVDAETVTSGPAPVEPTPVEPTPVEPAPVEPAPVEPAPTTPVAGATTLNIDNQWNSGFTAVVHYTPDTATNDWTVQIRFGGEIENVWNGQIIAQDGDLYTIGGVSYNSELNAGETARIKIKGAGDAASLELADGEGSDGGDMPTTPTPTPAPSTELLVQLVDTDTDAVLAEISDGQILPEGLTDGRNVSVVVSAVDPEFAAEIGSVRIAMGDYVQVDNVLPYSLFGDDDGDYKDGVMLSDGAQQVRIEIFSEFGARGQKLVEQNTSFEVQVTPETEPETVPEDTVPDGNAASASFVVENSWKGGFKAAVTVENTSDKAIEDWSMSFANDDFAIRSIWGTEMSVDDGTIVLDPKDNLMELAAGETVSFGFVANGAAPEALDDLELTYIFDGADTDGGNTYVASEPVQSDAEPSAFIVNDDWM